MPIGQGAVMNPNPDSYQPRSRWLPLHRWACTCEATGQCATCRAFTTPGAAGAIRQRLDALEARQRWAFSIIAKSCLDRAWEAEGILRRRWRR